MSVFATVRVVALALLAFLAGFSALGPSLAASDDHDLETMPAALLMVDDAGCVYCRKWDREVAPGYENSDEGRAAPLVRRPIRSADVTRYPGVRYTPTFLLLVEGREIGRIIGYPGPDLFWGEFNALFAKSGLKATPHKAPEEIRTDLMPETVVRMAASLRN
jgi:hypothetical protein